ncbi:MAG: carbohydrate ABC transporter substrate-binding protein [Eubacteriales bacterium]|nr:carbohydrate ABC transporter substrate-binding protein [Eubacteriales bacterium]
MKRKVMAMLLATSMVCSLSACGSAAQSDAPAADAASEAPAAEATSEAPAAEEAEAPAAEEKSGDSAGTINLWAFTDEVPGMVEKFKEANPDFNYDINTTIIATTDGAYQPALDQALAGGGKDAPDMYCAESAFVLKYTQGDASGYAAPYKDLGIDVDAAIKDAQIAQYSVDIGTNTDGDVVGLGYQATGGCFIYRRSIAKDTWGTDDPAEISKIIGGGTGSWDTFFKAAEDLKAKGYGIVSGDGDIWHAVENSSDQGWIVDGKLNIDPKREAFMDLSKQLKDNDYHNDTQDWQDAWFADMKGEGSKQIFGFFGPAWLINYTLAPNCGGEAVGEGTYGDWAVCDPPIGFFWGGTWVLANKDSEKKEAVGQIIEWITLNATEDGLQYKWANGTLNGEGGTKDAVASNTVMEKSDGSLDFLGGQNMFEYFVPANTYANGKNLTQYDETINQYWRDAVRTYTSGEKSKEDAISAFKQNVADNLDVIVE